MKILAAQINMVVGDLDGNTKKISDIVDQYKNVTDVLVFPELSITGYPPLDLIEQSGFFEEQYSCLEKIADLTQDSNITVILGYFDKHEGNGKPFHNGLAVLSNGIISHKYFKRLLPTYNIFDESRHFEAGKDIKVIEIQGIKVGLLICEDMWNDKAITNNFIYPINPIEETVKAGAEILISINASPSQVGKPRYRLEKFAKITKNYGVPLVYVNQVGGNDDIVFDGTSFVADGTGSLVSVLKSFEEDQAIFDIIKNDEKISIQVVKGDAVSSTLPKTSSEFYFKQIVLGIREYIKKCGFKKVVIASSGGVDSALVLALAVEAVGGENVVAITMPSAVSSTGSVTDSERLCQNLGVKLYNYAIKSHVDLFMDDFAKYIKKSEKSLTVENMQARFRGMVLMAFSNEYPEYLPLTTGNKSESAVGYCTLYGDMNGGLAPISDLYKTEVWDLCRYINDFHGKEIIPTTIIDKAPSAELYDGQKDTDSLPPYPVLDSILIPYIEGRAIDPQVLEQCKKIVTESGFTDFAKIHRMVDRAEFKRRQAAPTIRVHEKAWGAGRRFPIAQNHKPFNNLI
ncbi:MAG: NAD+ synthase [Patescibacteria group bacterium]